MSVLFVSLYVLCYPVNGSVCLVCCVSDGVRELSGETIAECDGVVCDWRCSIGSSARTECGMSVMCCMSAVL